MNPPTHGWHHVGNDLAAFDLYTEDEGFTAYCEFVVEHIEDYLGKVARFQAAYPEEANA